MSHVTESVPNVLGDVTSYAGNDSTPITAPPRSTIPAAIQPSDAPDALMQRVRRLANFTWSSTAAPFTFTAFYPGTELLKSLTMTTLNVTNFAHFGYRAVNLRFTHNATKFFRGILGVTFVPGPYNKNNAFAYTPTALSSLPTAYIDAASMTAVDYSYPWTSIRAKDDFASLNAGLGHVILWVVDPLVCETAPGISSSIQVSIEASFVDGFLSDPCAGFSTPPIPPARVTNVQGSGAFVYAQGPGKGVAREAENKAEKGTISSALDTTSKIAGMCAPIPVVGGFAAGLSVVTKAASSVFDFFGLSKPQNLGLPMYTLANPIPYKLATSGVTNADVLSADQLPYVATEPSYVCSTRDECNLDLFRSRPSLITVGKTTTLVGGTPALVASIPVLPAYGWAASGNYQPSNIGVLGSAFHNWSGDVAFKFVVPANQLVRTRLAIMYSLTKQITFSEENRYMFIEIEGTTVIDGVIPWTRREPAVAIPKIEAPYTSAPFANGYVSIFQMSDIVADTPAVTPSPLSVLVFAAGTTNTNFAILRSLTTRGLSKGAAYPQGFLGLTSSIKIDGLLAEANIRSIREILHRPWVFSVGNIVLAKTTHTPNYANFWITMFRFLRGSMTITLESTGDAPDVVQIENPSVDDSSAYLSWYPSTQRIFKFTIPFASAQGAVDTGAFYGPETIGRFTTEMMGANPNYWLRMSCSFNDDLSLGVQCPPRFIVP